jgi:hypothetical protein
MLSLPGASKLQLEIRTYWEDAPKATAMIRNKTIEINKELNFISNNLLLKKYYYYRLKLLVKDDTIGFGVLKRGRQREG